MYRKNATILKIDFLFMWNIIHVSFLYIGMVTDILKILSFV